MSQPDRIEVQCAQEAQIYMKSSMAAHFLFGVRARGRRGQPFVDERQGCSHADA